MDVLQGMLEAAGIPVWRDTAKLWPGEDWRARIRDAITRDALAFIACFSSHSAARQKSYMNEELVLAIEELRLRWPDVPWLMPVRFDDCDVPDLDLGAGRRLTSIQRIDLFGAGRDLAVGRLVEAVRRLLWPPAPPVEEPIRPAPGAGSPDAGPYPPIGQDPAYTRGMVSSGQINQEFPETAPGVLALLGDLQHAIDEAMAVPYPMSRVGAISEIAIIISANDPDKAKELAITAAEFAVSAHRDLIPDDNEMRLLKALVSVGLAGRALEMVMNMEHPESRALGFAILATAYADTPESAEILVAEAEKSVSRIDRSGWTPGIGGAQINQARFYAQIANILAARLPAVAERTLAKAGDTARSIHDADSKKRALTAVAEAVSSRLPEQAARFSEEADRADN